MEAFVESLKRAAARLRTAGLPYLRQALRFLALPYCYFFQVDWRLCTRSRLRVAGDLLYIFFRLGYYPDNYGPCRLFEQDRSLWRFYFGSSYNPFQKARLARTLQPPRYHVLFEDKEVCHQLCRGLGLPLPHQLGVLAPGETLGDLAARLEPGSLPDRLILKPVAGAAGAGIFLAERRDDGAWTILGIDGKAVPDLPPRRSRYVVQSLLEQHADLAAVYPGSVNSMRVITLLTRGGAPRVLAAALRFGAGGNRIDNWSRGGVVLHIDLTTGSAAGVIRDKHGRQSDEHPDTGVPLRTFRMPRIGEVLDLALRTQACFPYYGMLGLDIAVTPDGPVLIEINAFPDLVGIEQTWGPLLADPEILLEFARHDLLTHSMRRALGAELQRACAGEGSWAVS